MSSKQRIISFTEIYDVLSHFDTWIEIWKFTGVVALQVAKQWQGHVTVCVHHRVSPLVTLLGADQVISLPHDPEKAEIKCKDIFNSEDSLFDLCIITSEDSLLSEEFCQVNNSEMKIFEI